ncbi:MAG TPA: carboxypeptidase regulatory-like domain-containing protein, partial [Saprospiraceae bacterium]|nr:carboxypeptidase regulatory-like domain-containing protein [Saprospiraceae bacterium]
MFKKLLFPTLLLWCATLLQGQDLRGTVLDTDDGQPVANASVVLSGTGKVAATDANGQFVLKGASCPAARCTLTVSIDGYSPATVEFASNRLSNDPFSISLSRIPTSVEEEVSKPSDIPTVTLEEAESETEGASEVANVLNANQDVFQRISNFGWSAFRFRERGYDGGLFQTFINGMPFNDLETGFTSFGEFGGLNDVFRLRNSTVGLDPAEFTFGGPGGSTLIDTRASSQRKQIRASYASSNRTYRNRLMLTASTGLMPGGWAVTLSGSHRWADEGYVPGTFMDAWAYFVGIDKKFGRKHSLSLTVFGAPTKRGRQADSFQEMYDLAGSNYYNPNWGYQNGQKRNASVGDNHQPTAILRYDWNPSVKTSVMATAYAQSGKNDLSRINFVSGKNPNPDFNRRLPSSFENPDMAALQADLLSRDEDFRQINWAGFYDANRLNQATIPNADGKGESLTGLNSIYVLANDRSLNTDAGLNLVL